ncbi:MAG: AAA family ATPase [Prosthecobacter sp.]|uniref:AAA family ATPase n=1 Tax=Prosthecobacter sp. TaxID=1965333 RepID=UPI0038FD993A
MSTPATKLSLSQLTLHNPSRMKDAEIIATFAVRQRLLDNVLADIAAEKPRSRALHQLIIGRRGMGKSTLLARIAAELRTDAYSSRFIPLVFAEEQYSVDRLSKFWLNCLDSLADAHERTGDKAAADAIDTTIRSLPPTPASQEEEAAKAALEAFLKAAENTGRRPVLLVDNLQLVFERLPKAQQHVLRELLMRPGCPILIGASPSALPESQDYGAPFYDQFKVRYLERLSEDEMRQLMLHLAEVFHRPDVRDRVLAHPRRITVLRQLTGGNPRTTVTLFFLYAEDFAPGVFGDLQNLLDRVTPLYKALFEELSVQQQVIASAIANHWDPVTARQLSEDTGLPITGISPQLDRLERIGFIEKVSLRGQSATGFLITERFFNVWFLMRLGSRRNRQAVEYLTRLIETVWDEHERARMAQSLLVKEELQSGDWLLVQALHPLLDSATADDLRRRLELLSTSDAEARRKLEEAFDFVGLHPATLAFADMRKTLHDLVPDHAPVTPEEFSSLLLGDRRSLRKGQVQQIASSTTNLTMEQVDAAVKAAEYGRKIDEFLFSEEASIWFAERLASGQIRLLQNAEDWSRAFLQAPKDYATFALMADTLPPEAGRRLMHPALERVFEVLEPARNASSGAWRQWGKTLSENLGLINESQSAYQVAIEIDPTNVEAWIGLGDLSRWHRRDPAAAECAYNEACKHSRHDNKPFIKLGLMLLDLPGRQPDALKALNRTFIEGEVNADALFGLVILSRDYLGDLTEAKKRFEHLQRTRFGETDSYQINKGLIDAYDANWGNACDAWSTVIQRHGRQGIPPETMHEWLRATAVLVHLGVGGEFLTFLKHWEAHQKFRPWYEAIAAIQAGDRLLLQNIAPEVRETAEKLYDEIDRRLQMLPEKTRRRPLAAAATKKRKK